MANIKAPKGTGTWDEVTKKGKTYIRFRKTYDYERKEFTGRTKAEVLKKIKDYESNPISSKTTNYKKMYCSDFLTECNECFCKENRHLQQSTIDERVKTIEHIANNPLGKAQLGCVTQDLIEKYLFSRVQQKIAKSTINKELGFIKRCFRRAIELKALDENPACNIASLTEEEVIKATKKVTSLEEDDMFKLVREAKRINTDKYRINGLPNTKVYGVNADVVVFLLFTGLRVGEALALKWQNVDLAKKQIHIVETLKEVKDETGKYQLVCGKTKTESSIRFISLSSYALSVLEEQKKRYPNPKGTDFVFRSEADKPVLYRNVNRTLQDMLRRSKCSRTDATVHCLRHTYGSYLLSKGTPVFSVSRLLGHSSVQTTEKVYAHLLQSGSQEAIKPLEAFDFNETYDFEEDVEDFYEED